jgi:hypothetical protein
MKKAFIVLAIVGLLAGCTTFESVMSAMSEPMVDSANILPKMEFTILYATSAAFGGYAFGEDNFPVGTGVTWQVISAENGGEIDMTRAKLSPGGEGAFWWSLEMVSDDQNYYYEFLVDKDDVILKVRYRDIQSGNVKEFVPDPLDSEDEEALPEDYSDYIVGKERITTPAGTFNADKMVFDDPDSSYTATYWIADSVPGKSVRYVYEDSDEGETVTGELIAVEKGFETVLGSY